MKNNNEHYYKLHKRIMELKSLAGDDENKIKLIEFINKFSFDYTEEHDVSEKLITELEKYFKNEPFDLLLIINLARSIERAESEIIKKFVNEPRRSNSMKTVHQESFDRFRALEKYLYAVDVIWDNKSAPKYLKPYKEGISIDEIWENIKDQKYQGSYTKKDAIDEVWEMSSEEIKEIILEFNEGKAERSKNQPFKGSFISIFDDYLEFYYNKFGMTHTGRKPQKRKRRKHKLPK